MVQSNAYYFLVKLGPQAVSLLDRGPVGAFRSWHFVAGLAVKGIPSYLHVSIVLKLNLFSPRLLTSIDTTAKVSNLRGLFI